MHEQVKEGSQEGERASRLAPDKRGGLPGVVCIIRWREGLVTAHREGSGTAGKDNIGSQSGQCKIVDDEINDGDDDYDYTVVLHMTEDTSRERSM